MRVFFACLAEAFMEKGFQGLLELVPGGSYLASVAESALKKYRERQKDAEQRAELQELAQAGFEEARKAAVEALKAALPPGITADERFKLELYLSQVPGTVRQSLKRSGDPTGKTVPTTFSLSSAADVLRLLPVRAPRFKPGDTVPGLPSWVLVEPLGFGGFGEVWKAKHPYAGLSAFKFFLDPETRRRFTCIEAETLQQIHKDVPPTGVVKLLGAEPEQEPPWIQLEYAEGGDLSRLPEAWKGLSDEGRVKRVQGVIRSLAATVGHFHDLGVVHRDLKPSNILLRKTPSKKYQPVIADFGISKILPTDASAALPSNTATAMIVAYTAMYASPQQKQLRPADRRDDVYALAVLWYQLLRNDLNLERPSGDGWKRTLAKMGVTEAAIALLNRCWDDEAEVRPADGNELASLLAALTATPAEADPQEAELPQWQDNERDKAPEEERHDRRPQSRRSAGGHSKSLLIGLGLCVLTIAVLAVVLLGGSTNREVAENQPVPKKPKDNLSPNKTGQTPSTVVSPKNPTAGDEVHFPLPAGLKMTFCWIPPGTAQLGSPRAERLAAINAGAKPEEIPDEGEETRGRYTTKGFWLGKYPVTQGEWQALMGNNPSWFKVGGGGAEWVKGNDTARFPIENVSWEECQPFINSMNELSGVGQVFGKGARFALPHEDAWEYACRGGMGNHQPFYWGNSVDGTQANMNGRFPFNTSGKGVYLERTTEVGSYSVKSPHPWGLCDMHGNVWQWCGNRYEQRNTHVRHGGSWSSVGHHCRAACRSWASPGPGPQNIYTGLRLIVVIEE